MSKKLFIVVPLWFLALLSLAVQGVFAAQLTKSTEEMLRKLKLDPSILTNVDRELQLPKEWLDKAKSEGRVRFLSTLEPGETKILFTPLKSATLSSTWNPQRRAARIELLRP